MMKRPCILILGLLACGILAPASTGRPPAPGHVVLVSIDGFAAFHLQNDRLLLPNIRDLARSGVQAESSQTVFPSVTHPSHTTMITGVPPRFHGVIGNQMRNRLTGESFHVTNKPRSEAISATTLFDAARRKGLVTAAFFWPETKADPSIQINIPEAFDEASAPDFAHVSPGLLRELRDAGIPIDLYPRWYSDLSLKGAADAVLTQAAAHIIRTRRPEFLAIHLLVTDSTQHAHGPDHYLSAAALTTADYNVGVLRRAVRDAGLEDSTTFFIVADHGFHTVRYEANLRPLFQESGLLDRVALHPGGWTMYVETTARFDRARDSAALERVFERALSGGGVSRVVRPDEFHALGLPTYEENPHIPGQYLLVGDIDTYLVSREGPGGRTLKETPSHSHGYLPDHPRMHPSFVVSGRGVRRGSRMKRVSNYDIAPTISYLLDLGMTGLTGRVLREALPE